MDNSKDELKLAEPVSKLKGSLTKESLEKYLMDIFINRASPDARKIVMQTNAAGMNRFDRILIKRFDDILKQGARNFLLFNQDYEDQLENTLKEIEAICQKLKNT